MELYFPDPPSVELRGLTVDSAERKFLYEVGQFRPEFIKLFAQSVVEGERLCPKCITFRTDLYDVPVRFTKYLYHYARSKQQVCAYCLSEAAERRNCERANGIAEFHNGEITIGEQTRKIMRSAGWDLENRTGAVYLAQRGDAIKIGATSRDVRERVRQLGAKTHSLLMSLHLDAPFILESYLHAHFVGQQVLGKNWNKSRVCRRTDYFRLSSSDIDSIASIRLFEGMPVRVELA